MSFRNAGFEGDFDFLYEMIDDARRAIVPTLKDLRVEIPEGEMYGLEEVKKIIDTSSAFNDFVSNHLDGSAKTHITKLRDAIATFFVGNEDGEKKGEAEPVLYAVQGSVSSYVRETTLGFAQEGQNQALPEEFKKFLPPNLTIELESYDRITKVTDLFANEVNDVDTKMKKMLVLIDRYNDIVDRVKSDMTSSNLSLRLRALMVAIMMETGIRPGYANDTQARLRDAENKYVKDENGEFVYIDTFGARTLKLSFISKVVGPSIDEIRVEFPGKAATTNVAYLSDKDVVRELIKVAERATITANSLDIDPFLFEEESGGRPLSGSTLSNYFNQVVQDSGLTLTDFRKLEATQAVFSHLKNRKIDLLHKIRTFIDEEAENLEEKVAEEVANLINEAVSEAQTVINHKNDFKTTISYYINPRVILKFITNGDVGRSLKRSVMRNPRTLKLNLDSFIGQAKQLKLGHTLESLVEDLEMSLGDETRVGETLESLLNHLEETI
tara:strand:+ start:2750 stop:4240 length:1491 start_codon:yes stop_codon:yes gene_type:complete